MRNFVRSHWLPASLAIIVLLVTITGGEQIRRWWSSYTPAIEWQGVEVVTKEVQPGGELAIVYTAQVNRTCPADLRGFLVAQDGSVPVRYPIVAGGYTLPSSAPVLIQVRVTVPVKADGGLGRLLPGPYVYRTMATRYCPDGVQEDTHIPDAPFTLKEIVE